MRLIAVFLFCFSTFTTHASQEDVTLKQFEQLVKTHKNKVIYVDFWASWCVPCKQSFPWMNEMQEKYQAQGFTVLSVNLDAQKKHADAFLAEIPATFPVFFDPKGKLTKTFKIKGMPSSFLINREGKNCERSRRVQCREKSEISGRNFSLVNK